MRLLKRNSAGQLSLTEKLVGDNIPQYAILSHTWGADTEEVTFQDLTNGTSGDKSGYKKVHFCGGQASRDGLQYFWVDTCCIDKSSSAELTEAINSMFRWYRNAAKCYVYLSDVSTNDHDQADPSLQSWQSAFRKSRWFTRGWTLQELIAPLLVEFFCSNGERLGDKTSLERQLYEITGIVVPALRGTSLSTFSVEDRMSWAENRHTKCEEDRAYSLLGIFDVSMPLIYGEGAEKAFDRLKEELFKRSRKHQLDELSPVSHTFNSAKRFKTLHSQSSSVPSSRNSYVLDPRPSSYSEYSINSNNPPETRTEPITGASDSEEITKESLIKQLYFTKIDERLTTLTAARGTTCRWFLTKPEYTSWNNMMQEAAHGGFLWIQGNPGTGKSTLMKLLFEETKLNVKGNSRQITLSFFFLARGTIEEKSTTGLYRSLLHQLFQKAEELKRSLKWITPDGVKVIQRSGWHEEALKHTFTHAVKNLGSRVLTIFIDALDECNDSQAMGMVGFLEELCDVAREAQVRLQICFSSRHYPTIVIRNGIKVTFLNNALERRSMRRYTGSPSVLYMLAEENFADLIRIHPQRASCFDVENQRHSLPILASLTAGSHEAVLTFLEIQTEIHPHELLLHHLRKEYLDGRDKRTNFEITSKFLWQKGGFFHVAGQGSEIILIFFRALGKVDVEEKDDTGGTPLLWAARNGRKAIVKLLLEKGANPEIKDRFSQTPLLLAVGKGYKAIVQLLLEKGANLDIVDFIDRTLLSLAIEHKFEAIVELLVEKGADLEVENKFGLTSLLYAAKCSHEAVVKLLIEKGADLKAIDRYSQTPLIYAVKQGHKAVVQLLLEKGVDLEAADNDSQTPLLYAVEKGHVAIVKLLLKKGVNLESIDDSGYTPLLLAVEKGHQTIVKLLRKKGARK
ncbi:hypothetical protein EG329_012092 [Mollisiaceae sp. DMI_Dod_QoI]|nr:hypothetical protein EG329_012092 [Helotiales sp. DMI_Dod_QoI]